MLEFKSDAPPRSQFRRIFEAFTSTLQSFDPHERLIMLFVLLMALFLPGQAIYQVFKERTSKAQWEAFKSDHMCKVTARQIGSGTVDEPESTDWICEDGVTYNVKN